MAAVLKLTERWSRPELISAINERIAYPSPVRCLMMWALLTTTTDSNSIIVEFTSNTPNNQWALKGRRYAKGGHSLQNAPKWLRRRVSPPGTVEIDIVNCHPTFFYYATKDMHHMLRLKYYLDHRDATLHSISQQTGKTPKEVKSAICALLNGGGWRNVLGVAGNVNCDYLSLLQQEVRAARSKFLDTRDMKNLISEISDVHGLINAENKAMSLYLQIEERRAIDNIMTVCELEGVEVCSLLHDGLLAMNVRDDDDFIEKCQLIIKENQNVDIQLKIQSMAPQPSDYHPYKSSDIVNCNVTYKDDIHVTTPKFSPEEKCICIKAGMGSGKTWAMMDFFKTQFSSKERALLITGRINQADSLEGLLTDVRDGLRVSTIEDEKGDSINVFLYNDIDDAGSIHSNLPGIYIIQWESLHKLTNDLNCYHGFNYLFIDEIRTVLNQSCSAMTNKSRLRMNMNLFKDMCLKTKVVMMDADLLIDEAVENLLFKKKGGFWEDHEVRIESYTHQSMHRSINIELDEARWLQEVKNSFDESKKRRLEGDKCPTLVVVRSKRSMHDIIHALCNDPKPQFLDNGIAYFSSESSNSVMATWKNINGFINENDVDIIFTTSKVTVCADIQIPILKCFVHAASQGGCHARDLYQTMGRARNLINTEISVLTKLPSAITGEVLSFSEFKKNVREVGKMRYSFIEWLDSESGWTMDENLFNRVRTEESPEWMMNLACVSQREIECNMGAQFLPTFMKVASYKRWNCSFESDMRIAGDIDVKENKKSSGRQIEESEQKALDRVKILDNEEIIKLSKVRTNDGSKKAEIQIAKCLSRFLPIKSAFEVEWLKYYSTNAQTFDRALLLSSSHHSMESRDAMSIMYAQRNSFMESTQIWSASSNVMFAMLKELDIDESDFHEAEMKGSAPDNIDSYYFSPSRHHSKWEILQGMNEAYENGMNKNKSKKKKHYKEINNGIMAIVRGALSDWGRELEGIKETKGENRNSRTYKIVLQKSFASMCGSYIPKKDPIAPESTAMVMEKVREVHFRKRKENPVTDQPPKTKKKPKKDKPKKCILAVTTIAE
jgi:hypothetical protein